MQWSIVNFAATLAAGVACSLVYWFILRKRGERYEEVIDKVVEEHHNESAQLQTLWERQEVELRKRDGEVLQVRAKHQAALDTAQAIFDADLAAAKADHDRDLVDLRADNDRLRAENAHLATVNEEVVALHGRLKTQKEEYGRLEADWRKRVEEADAATAVEVRKAEDLAASRERGLRATVASMSDRASAAEKGLAEFEDAQRHRFEQLSVELDTLRAEHDRLLASQTSGDPSTLRCVTDSRVDNA